ncbi:MAG: hypothetical protein IJ762_09665 [Bacteroidaceae bacterium]|nr:hypothetical protein [Bacteroidaceae bacterium]MBR1789435.1 hypothetical protein [Bacteroidaceae bacterium]
MRKTTAIILCAIGLALSQTTFAAGPKWAKKVQKSIVRLYAIQAKGDTLRANGFYIDEDGGVIAPFKFLQEARSAWAVDESGMSHEVKRIAGFNATYDIAKLKVATGKKKNTCLPIAAEAATKGQTVYLLPKAEADAIKATEKAGNFNYYTLGSMANPELAGTPLVDELGAVVAIVQTPIVADKAPNYALDIKWAEQLSIRAMDINSSEMRNCRIPLLLPSDESQAVSFLYLASASNNELKATYAEDFVEKFPESGTGYIQKAEMEAERHDYEAAYRTYEEGLEKAKTQKDELLYARSRSLYNAVVQRQENLPETWTMEQALKDVTAAKEINALPLYTLQEAHTLFASKRYEEAYQRYMEVTQTKMRSAEVFLYAWQCRQNLKATNEELLALNDSAVACFTKPYNAEAAPYLLLRSNTLSEMGRLRDAINDLNDYEHLMQGQLTGQFYYKREQLESRTRMLGQAVNDIHKAISLDGNEPVYHAELAVLLFRLNDIDNAITECQKAIGLDEKFPDAYRLMGICLREKGDKEGARRNLQKAIELGDQLAAGILEKLEN